MLNTQIDHHARRIRETIGAERLDGAASALGSNAQVEQVVHDLAEAAANRDADIINTLLGQDSNTAAAPVEDAPDAVANLLESLAGKVRSWA